MSKGVKRGYKINGRISVWCMIRYERSWVVVGVERNTTYVWLGEGALMAPG